MPNDIVIDVVVHADQAIASLNELNQTTETWNSFTAARMGSYMKQYGSHAAAIRQIAVEWKAYKAGLNEVGQQAERTAQQTDVAGKAASMSGYEYRRAGVALFNFGLAMTNILMLSNLLPESMGKGVRTTLLLATATINAVYAISQLKKAYDALTASIAASAVITNLHTAASLRSAAASAVSGSALKFGGASLLSKLGVAGAVAAVGYGSYELGKAVLPKSWTGGEQPRGGNTYNFNGPVLGTEAELARRLTELQRENDRLGR